MSEQKTIVVIPTYDERENVAPMSEAVLEHGVEILFVDDNSPDGTGAALDGLAAADPRIHVLHREKKEGLGRAYVAGFRRALELGADFIVQMDCDFSHDPDDVPRLVAACAEGADLAIGSRYVKGGATPGWPFRRRLVSRCGGIFIRTVTGMPLRDPTGGFKCWRRETLEKIDFGSVASAGYSFQLEMNHRTWREKLMIREVPISFTDRVAGYSKITAGIAKESLKIAWRLRRAWLFAGAAAMLACGSLFGGEAQWIWYPGDYGIWWGNAMQSERLQWGSRLTPFWPLYEPHNRVIFRKELKLAADEPLEIRCDGNAAICWTPAGGGYVESAAILGRLTLPKDATAIEVKIQNSLRPPSIWMKGPHLVTDSDWKVLWTRSGDAESEVYAESSARFRDPATPPGLAKLPVSDKKPAWVRTAKGNHLLADFGEETYGYLRFLDVKGRGAVKVIYAESEAEMMAEDLTYARSGALDGWEMLELSEAKEVRREIAHGFRYVHVIPCEGDVTVGGLTMDFETKAMPVRGAFRCDDELVNRIWDVAVHTLDLTCREVFIEGVKRDHWVWSGDAVQSFLMNYYVFGDYDGCRDTLWTLRGKDPVRCHLNGIMDYTFYWFDAVEKYRLYSGDAHFANQVYPRMKTLLEYALGRLDADGRPVDRPGDWMFIDWASKPLPNYGGVTSFEQMLLVRALEATAGVARDVGRAAEAEAYLARAKKLRGEIVPRYWNAEKGGLMHLIRNDGTTDPMITRYPNMFGLFYGYFDEAQKASVVKNVMLNDDVLKIQTPYMRFYELEALCAIGMQPTVLGEIRSYWGDMLGLGATSFWELYNPTEKGEAHYAMYGRRFGKSLCHAWGASPAYLLGKYFLGVVPTGPGFSTYVVKPELGGLKWMEGAVPTPSGEIRVSVRDGRVTVRGNAGAGTLVWKGAKVPIPANGSVTK